MVIIPPDGHKDPFLRLYMKYRSRLFLKPDNKLLTIISSLGSFLSLTIPLIKGYFPNIYSDF